VVSGTQIYIAESQKRQELEATRAKNERDWRLQLSQLLIANKASMTGANRQDALFIRNVALATIPESVTAPIFGHLADISDEPAMRAIWRDGTDLAIAVSVERTLKAPASAQVQATPGGLPRIFTTESVSKLFPHAARANIEKQLPFVLDALEEKGLLDQVIATYALASIRAETEGFVPISEGVSRFNTSPEGKPFDLYEKRRDLGNIEPGDGYKYRGRGFIQMTGRAFYSKMSNALGLGDKLINEPELANDSKIAAQAVAYLISANEKEIRSALAENNLVVARRLFNGGMNGLDRFAQAYKTGLALEPS
jgi:peptidoglycan L-alanyl-D-glutamate endopeptidase CwlK